MPVITYQLRKQWLCQQVQDMDHIVVRVLDETDIPEYPAGWAAWSARMREVVPEGIDAFFVGDREYEATLQSYFPESEMVLFDPARSRYPISATEIRHNILGNWHYILGPARPFFAKKVLIAGTESCGKTTLTKCLAKLFNTSWSEEVGRYYAQIYLGGDESIFTDEDFGHMAHLQAGRTTTPAHRQQGVFLAIRTRWSPIITAKGCAWATATSWWRPTSIDRYDVLYLAPDVAWVNDDQPQQGSGPPGNAGRTPLCACAGVWLQDKMIVVREATTSA